MNVGWERKIGYSFVGLMAGNAASLVALLLIALLPSLDAFSGISKLWNLNIEDALLSFMLFALVSMLGWVVVGLPVILSLRTEVAADLYWITAALVGGVLGILTMFLLLLALSEGHVDRVIDARNPQ